MTFTICIPRVNSDIKKEKIKSVFNKYNFGDLHKIVILENTHYNKVFIHYKALYNNEKTQQIQKAMIWDPGPPGPPPCYTALFSWCGAAG